MRCGDDLESLQNNTRVDGVSRVEPQSTPCMGCGFIVFSLWYIFQLFHLKQRFQEMSLVKIQRWGHT
jgi:hypothetical protein